MNYSKTLLLLCVCSQMTFPAFAESENVALLSETAHSDEALQSTMLYGNVKRSGENSDGGSLPKTAGIDLPVEAKTTLKAAAYQKLSHGVELSSEEYRALGIGCIGYESLRTFFQLKGKITAVYKNSPAEKAGLRVGETIIQDASDNEAEADPTVPLWSVSLAKAGDPVNIIVERHGHIESLTILRGNIEDIEEPAVRAEWEKIVRDLGYPREGTFTGRSMDSLHRTFDDAGN